MDPIQFYTPAQERILALSLQLGLFLLYIYSISVNQVSVWTSFQFNTMTSQSLMDQDTAIAVGGEEAVNQCSELPLLRQVSRLAWPIDPCHSKLKWIPKLALSLPSNSAF